MRILVLDNYDSFTFNLVYLVRQLGYESQMKIFRNDKIDLESVSDYDKILLSPGPGIPETAGIMKELISRYAETKSILGVCLGHQGIAEVFGAELYNMPLVLHGIPGRIRILDDQESLFKDVPESFTACHYHSWSVNPESINGTLQVTAIDDEERIMAISHKKYDVKGLQFHPESILTEHGYTIMENWLKS
jgi:anthranilate synthase component 2